MVTLNLLCRLHSKHDNNRQQVTHSGHDDNSRSVTHSYSFHVELPQFNDML